MLPLTIVQCIRDFLPQGWVLCDSTSVPTRSQSRGSGNVIAEKPPVNRELPCSMSNLFSELEKAVDDSITFLMS